MKSSDIAMIILIASVSVGVAFFVVKSLPFFKMEEQDAVVKQIEPIDAGITDPSPDVFNSEAINPTIPALIGSSGSPASED